ncbi:MAG: hypothetical protein ABEI98_12475 [Halorhabdus sp.]
MPGEESRLMETEDTPGTVDQLRENRTFSSSTRTPAASTASLTPPEAPPDSGWFVLALAGPNPRDDYERQHRIHDSDTHRVLLTHLKDDDQETEA